jgi:hypothetical protein
MNTSQHRMQANKARSLAYCQPVAAMCETTHCALRHCGQYLLTDIRPMCTCLNLLWVQDHYDQNQMLLHKNWISWLQGKGRGIILPSRGVFAANQDWQEGTDEWQHVPRHAACSTDISYVLVSKTIHKWWLTGKSIGEKSISPTMTLLSIARANNILQCM